MKAVGLAVVAASLSGCIGSNAVTGYVMKFNLEVVDNRYARGGVNMLLAPVYALTVAVDALIFNSLEFWTGKNPINGKPHIFDTKTKTMMNINDDLDPSLTDAPVDPITMREVEKSTFEAIDENTIQMNITYNNGDKAVVTGVRDGDNVSYYYNGELVSETTIGQLEEMQATKA
ncbi:ABC-type multidrug transport system [Vibrio ishigakensis]|uniref:ABC-type multidrug transport system n=2 Tax=Vibrio ishigakensis TaxID=1481914 RepID=A0A0B8NYG0_9VIBR|nr:ABC-type multidrug transport system [Vibrio ishigakensis]GAM69198.1 ABC-type multidrug transport system [Vibrio sp. JCM 19236]GAM72972.1 ABC-type multidrug transport system [Vibrio ishigakensis]